MTIDERRRRLQTAQSMVKTTQKRIRRLNTALKNWERRVNMHQKAIRDAELEAYQKRITELESQVGRPRRGIRLEP
jgi:predicted  nucleic acid-binding Zn-ribbon protein